MGGYVARRLLQAMPTLLGLSLLIFGLGSLTGDPAQQLAANTAPDGAATAEQIAAIRQELGLDRPLPLRYASWLRQALGGDLGQSLFTSRSVVGEVARAFPPTLLLAGTALVLIIGLGVPAGATGALFHRRTGDQVLRLLVLTGASMPAFFLAYLLIDVFAVRLHLLPVAGLAGPRSVVLPALALAIAPAAMVSRLVRASLLEVLGEDYMRTARAKGLGAVPVLVGHGLQNAALPVVTVLGSTLGRLLEGAVVVEVVFSWPGMGLLTYNAIVTYDYPVVVGTVLLAGALYVVLNLAVDLSYGLIDPRVRVGASAP